MWALWTLLVGLLPYHGSLVGFRISSFSRPPSEFKVQFHDAGPRWELGLDLSGMFLAREDSSLLDTLSVRSESRQWGLGLRVTMLQPVGRRALANGSYLQGLMGVGPWFKLTMTYDSLNVPGLPDVEEGEILEAGLGAYVGLEYAFSFWNLDLRLQGLVQVAGIRWTRNKTYLRGWVGGECQESVSTASAWYLEGLSLTQGNLGVWLFVKIP